MYFVAAVGPTSLRQIRNAVIDVRLHGERQDLWRGVKTTIVVINVETQENRNILNSGNIACGNSAITDDG